MYGAHGHPMGKTIQQVEAEWVTHGNIARLKYALAAEKNPGRRTWLEGLLTEQRALMPAET
jgi:hypothetical protein